MPNAGETQDFRAYIKENYVAESKGNLSHQNLHPVVIKIWFCWYSLMKEPG
jgi:hypothetical protein